MTAILDPGELTERLRALPGAGRLLDAIAAGDEEVWLVGGAVRDLSAGGVPPDLDLVVVGDVAGLATRLGARVRAHERFGTATVREPGGSRYDLARARRETYRVPGALPDVEPAGILEDLERRDFSVNALALGLSGPRRGELVAVAHGRDDLARGRLRVLHPASFRDDPTRLLRLARYAARLGFEVEEETAGLARTAIAEGALSTVSGERIGAELILLGEEADPVAAFAALRALGIDGAVAPGFGLGDAEGDGGGDRGGGDGGEPARRALALLPADGDPVALLLGLAAPRLSDFEDIRLLFAQLGLAAGRRDAALAVARIAQGAGAARVAHGAGAGGLVAALARADRPSQVDSAIGRAPVEAVAAAGALGDAAVARRAREWLGAWRHTTPAITGADLIAAGIPEGPRIAAGLRAARAAALDGRASGREAELAEALRAAGAAT